MAEHAQETRRVMRNVTKPDKFSSAIAAHYAYTGHKISARGKLFHVKILSQHNSIRATQIAEALHIEKMKPALNRKIEKPDLL